MGRKDQSKKDRRVRKHGGHDEDSDSSVDSRGNIRGIIDYDSEEDDDYVPRRRPVRKAAVIANKRIDRELALSKKWADRELKKNTVHYPEVRRKPKVEHRRVVESESEEVEETEEEEEEEEEDLE